MSEREVRYFSWDFFSRLIILSFCTLQVIRWPIFPQFMDTYYHIHTAWGFLQAGGYSGWDFWQYAPVGRIHIYPPVFHLILALLLKIGISPVILAKLFETIAPVVFLIVLWRFIRKYFGSSLAFFVALVFSSSFSYYLFLIDHLPSTMALTFGILSLGELFERRVLNSLGLVTLCFYTHIGAAYFIALSFIIFGLLNNEYRKESFICALSAMALSLPVIFKQLSGLRYISTLGYKMPEINVFWIKIFDYIFALSGIIFVFRNEKKFRIFFSLFLASFIFLVYPRRLFSGEGYLAVILLAALFLYSVYNRFKSRNIAVLFLLLVSILVLFISPSLVINNDLEEVKAKSRVDFFTSAFTGMLSAKGSSVWFPREYLSAAALIKENSGQKDIFYSTLRFAGVAVAGISGRATADALFPEIGPLYPFDPFLNSKIIMFTRDDDAGLVSQLVSKYNLAKIGENKMFILYKNTSCGARALFRRAPVPFWLIGFICLIAGALFLAQNKLKKFI